MEWNAIRKNNKYNIQENETLVEIMKKVQKLPFFSLSWEFFQPTLFETFFFPSFFLFSLWKISNSYVLFSIHFNFAVLSKFKFQNFQAICLFDVNFIISSIFFIKYQKF